MRKLLNVGTFVLLCTLLLTSPNLIVAQSQEQDWVARHRAEDREWAHKTGLSPNLIRQMRLTADVPDDESDYIDSVDAKSLRARNQILFVTAGSNGHCLGLYVFERRRAVYQLIWSAPGMPNGAGYCRESPYNPEAYVARDGRIMVKIPLFDYKKLKPRATDFYSYVWNGRAYKFSGRQRVSAKGRQVRSK